MAYELEGRTIYPLSDLLDLGEFPLADLLPVDKLAQVFDGLYYTEARSYLREEGAFFDIHLAFEGELALTPPGIQAVALVLGASSGSWTVVEAAISIGSDPSVELVEVPITLRVSKDVLRNVTTDGPAEISMNASLTLLGDGSLILETSDSLSLPWCEITDSGIQVKADNLTWNFAHGQSLPEAAAAGITGEFIGFAFQQAALKLPQEMKDKGSNSEIELSFDYCCIGTGGFTGGVTATFETPLSCEIGDFSVELHHVAVRFQESRLIKGEIEAVLKDLPFFDSDVTLTIQLAAGGGLRMALRGDESLLKLEKPDVISMTLTSAELIVNQGGGAVRLSGTITPLFKLPGGSDLPGFDVKALTITSKGEVSVDGGWMSLPQSTRVALGPFSLELTRVGLGSEPSGDRWVGFSGALRLVEGISFSAAVDGLKIIWNPATPTIPPRFELSGIALAFEIEDVLKLQGAVRFIPSADPLRPNDSRIDGAGTLQLVAINLTVSVQIVIGKRADYTYLYLYLLVQPPVGVPIFNTSLAFYSFEALYARNMIPDKKPAERWFHDWYRRKEIGTVDRSKWIDEKGNQAFGAGVMLGTLSDKGYSVAVKGLLIVLLPGPVLLLDARANLLKNPSELATPQAQALFNSLVVYDGPHGTLEMGIEPHYLYPENGEMVDVTGIAEAFYSFSDPRAWHLYLGQREPEKRIRARLFSIFDANAYLMLEPDHLELGGFIGYNPSPFKVGPASVVLKAYMEGWAFVSWRPKQLKGELQLQGTFVASACGITLGASVSAIVEAESPKPSKINAEVHARIDLPFPLPHPEATATLHWESPAPPQLIAPLQAVGVEHLINDAKTVSWPLDGQDVPVIPLDGKPSLVFERPVNDMVNNGAGIGANAGTAPDRQVGEYNLRANLVELEIEAADQHNLGNFLPYAGPNGQPRKLYGMWQTQPGNSGDGNCRLMLWVRTPYEWTRAMTTPSIAQLEEAEGFSPCEPMMPTQVVDFDGALNTYIPPYTPFAYDSIIWIPGRNPYNVGATIMELSQAIGNIPIVGTLPRPYYRCLFLPDQFGVTTAPSPSLGGSAGSTSAAAATLIPHTATLRIDFPTDLKGITVLLLHLASCSLEAFDATGASVGKVESADPVRDFLLSQLTLRATGIRRVEIKTDYRIALLAIAIQAAPTAAETSARRTAIEQTLEHFKSEEPVLDPNHDYRLRVVTTISETQNKSLKDATFPEWEESGPPPGTTYTINGPICTIVQTFPFRTQGPPGATELTSLPSGEKATVLETLDPYVRYMTPPRAAPNVYRNYDLGVAFNSDYVDHMYRSNGQELVLRLRSDQGENIILTNTMGKGSQIVLRREEHEWLSMLNRSTCQITLDESKIIRESLVQAQLQTIVLEPRRRYDVTLAGSPAGSYEGQRPLCEWSFITSAYLNFADHFQLRNRVRSALINTTTWDQWVTGLTRALESGDPWLEKGAEHEKRQAIEVEAFDTLFGYLDLEKSLPSDVEMHAVVKAQETWGMLLASPEPFDWERIILELKHLLPSLPVLDPAIPPLPPIPSIPLPVRSPIIHFPHPLGRPLREVNVTLRIIRNRDGTCALLTAVANNRPVPMEAGNYLLKGTFKRNLDNGLPVLSERGSTAAEEASITWSL